VPAARCVVPGVLLLGLGGLRDGLAPDGAGKPDPLGIWLLLAAVWNAWDMTAWVVINRHPTAGDSGGPVNSD
jgi:hypothetical protein